MITITESKRTADVPRYGMTVDGYTKRSGAPTSFMIRINGETRWRRVMVWSFSNDGTLFVRHNKKNVTINGHDVERALPVNER